MTDTPLKPGWRMVKFGDVVRNANLVERNLEEAGIERIVGLEHLDPENLHIRRWNTPENGTSFTRKFAPGQTLFGKRRAYQRKVAFAEFEGICSGDILTFEPKDPKVLLPELLPFICQIDRFFDHALGTSAGSLSPRTSWAALKKFEFPLPPIDEQKRIAEILWAADEVSEKKIQCSLAYDDFEITAINKLVEDAFNESIDETQKLDDVVKITDCKHKTPKLVEQGIAMVAPGNISWGPLQLDGCKQVSRDAYAELMDHVDVGLFDLVLSRNQTYGIASYVNSDTPFAIGQDTVLIQSKRISTITAFLFLKSSFVQQQVNRLSAGSTFKRINLVEIRKLRVPVANKHIEVKAEALFHALENARASLVDDRNKTCSLKVVLSNTLCSIGDSHV